MTIPSIVYRMIEMNTQQSTDKHIVTTCEFIRHFNDYIRNPEKKNEEQFVKVMKYMTRIVQDKQTLHIIILETLINKLSGI